MPSAVQQAGERLDADALIAQFADDVVFRSPVTDVPICGREQAGELLRAVFDAMERIDYRAVVRDGDLELLVMVATIAGREVHGIDLVRRNDAGEIIEFAVYARPMAGVALFAAAAGPRLARKRGRARAALVTAIAKPLPGMLRRGDRVVMRLAGVGR
jgi:hypothetical protein